MNSSSQPIVIELTILDISSIVSHERKKATSDELQNCVSTVKNCLRYCQDVSDNQEHHTIEIRKKLQEKILRYVWISDKYISLCSTLLKSWVYYEYTKRNDDTKAEYPRLGELLNSESVIVEKGFPVIALPSTSAKKPYIPSVGYDPECKDSLSPYPFNVSHQFPFVGIVHFPRSNYAKGGSTNNDKDDNHIALSLGLDIVTFSEPNSNLYKNTSEFLAIFKESFTSWEWERIKTKRVSKKSSARNCFKYSNHCFRSDKDALKEFYLRWSIKEAYTKAVGLGLGIPFESFETRLIGIDDITGTNHTENGIWENINKELVDDETNTKQPRYTNTIQGVVRFHSSIGIFESKEMQWNFAFVPLSSSEKAEKNNDMIGPLAKSIGCACVCIGQITPNCGNKHGNRQSIVQMRHVDLKELFEWH